MQFKIQKLETTASTNDDARQAADAGAPQGTVFWALEQKSGRGRAGRRWHSPPGNLYCSTLLRPKGDLRTIGHYSFIAALAIADTVGGFLPQAEIKLKWPNDVLVGGKKISGILLESGDGFLIIGIGLNVLHCPDNPLYPVTSLKLESAAPPALDALLERLLNNLDIWCKIYDVQGFAPVRAAWLTRALAGQMRVRLPDGELHGRFGDLDDDGNLHLILPDGAVRRISAGDVFL